MFIRLLLIDFTSYCIDIGRLFHHHSFQRHRFFTIYPFCTMPSQPLPLTLHQASVADAHFVHDIMTQSFGYEPWTYPTVQMALNVGAECYLASLNQQVVGYILCRSVLNESEIQSLGVLPDFQGQGVARYLMTSYEKTFQKQGGHHLFLEVAIDNVPAQNLYRDFGYKVTGMRHNYYQRPDGLFDAVLMSKHFNPE